METSAGTETLVVPVITEPMKPLPAAVMVAAPALDAETNPEPFTKATALLLELHETAPVMFCMMPLVYVPVAVSCRLVPGWTVGFTGVTAIEVSAGGATVNSVDPISEE